MSTKLEDLGLDPNDLTDDEAMNLAKQLLAGRTPHKTVENCVYITDHGTNKSDGTDTGGTFWHTDLEVASNAHDEAVKKYAGRGYVHTYRVTFDEIMGVFLDCGNFPDKELDTPVWVG